MITAASNQTDLNYERLIVDISDYFIANFSGVNKSIQPTDDALAD